MKVQLTFPRGGRGTTVVVDEVLMENLILCLSVGKTTFYFCINIPRKFAKSLSNTSPTANAVPPLPLESVKGSLRSRGGKWVSCAEGILCGFCSNTSPVSKLCLEVPPVSLESVKGSLRSRGGD